MDGPFNLIGATTQALGVELELLAGVPVTHLTRDFHLNAAYISVASTLGFPPTGWVTLASDVRVHYGAKSPTRFLDLTSSHLINLPVNTIVVSDVRAILPVTYGLFWDFPWAGNNFLLTPDPDL